MPGSTSQPTYLVAAHNLPLVYCIMHRTTEALAARSGLCCCSFLKGASSIHGYGLCTGAPAWWQNSPGPPCPFGVRSITCRLPASSWLQSCEHWLACPLNGVSCLLNGASTVAPALRCMSGICMGPPVKDTVECVSFVASQHDVGSCSG